MFLWWLNLKAFSAAWRGYNESHIALYDKRTGETVAIAGDGLIDDIDNGMTFFHDMVFVIMQWFLLSGRLN